MIRLLKTEAAGEYLGLSVRTLENWRYQGRGPKWIHMKRTVRYDLRDLDVWIEEHRKAT
jgi:predicted DNA-binding transcriptional regulator AlpA